MKLKQRVCSGRDYSSIANCRTKFPEIFLVIFGIFPDISNFLLIYSMISFGTTNEGWAEPRLGNTGSHYQRKRIDLDHTNSLMLI
jgi:hypothetical protein